MKVLHQIGDRALGGNFNTLEEILAHDGPISFDGVYMSVYENYKALKGKDVTLFFSGKYLGGDNSFDVGQPLSRFCTLEQIREMSDYLDAEIGYHGWAHLDCTKLSDAEVLRELFCPFSQDQTWIAPLRASFAWPYGECDERTSQLARRMGYQEAWSVAPKGDNSQFQKHRHYLNWHHG